VRESCAEQIASPLAWRRNDVNGDGKPKLLNPTATSPRSRPFTNTRHRASLMRNERPAGLCRKERIGVGPLRGAPGCMPRNTPHEHLRESSGRSLRGPDLAKMGGYIAKALISPFKMPLSG
jgi:hypothetical protein